MKTKTNKSLLEEAKRELEEGKQMLAELGDAITEYEKKRSDTKDAADTILGELYAKFGVGNTLVGFEDDLERHPEPFVALTFRKNGEFTETPLFAGKQQIIDFFKLSKKLIPDFKPTKYKFYQLKEVKV